MKKLKQIGKTMLVSAFSIIGSAGNALAAPGDGMWSGLNIRSGVDKFILQLDPSFQPAVGYFVDHIFALAVIGTLALLWWHSFSEKEAKRSGSVSGQAQHESMKERIMKNYGLSLVYSVLIIFFSLKCLV